MKFAYLSQGRIYLKDGDGPARLVESKFAADVKRRTLEMERRNAWKSEGTGARFMSGGRGMWGGGPSRADLPSFVTGLARGCSTGELVYSLDTSEVSGMFRLRDEGREEQRLLHTADFRVCASEGDEGARKLAFTMRHKDGTSGIAVMNHDGGEMTELTQGDSQDIAPRFTPQGDALLYQSAGVARTEIGVPMGRGPFVIEKLRLDGGDIETVAQDEKCDLLSPQMAADGSLWYIRKPYDPPNQKMSFWQTLLDFLKFPFRLLFAFFQFLSFFSARYTGKFLTSAGNAAQEADLRQMMIWGNMVEAAKHKADRGEETPDLVPATWQLVRQQPGGETSTIAKSVLAFDLCGGGAVLYSNGTAIFHRNADGKTERVEKAAFIQQLLAL